MTLVTTEWCGPCKTVKAFIDANKLDVKILDAQDNAEYCKSNSVRSVPTLITEKGNFVGSKDIIEFLTTNAHLI